MLQHDLQRIINNKTKPLGALGLLEETALRIGLIQGTTTLSIRRPHIVVFAADHGIAATGLVSPFPQAVTAQMVLNFLTGGAAINVFCRQHNIGLTVVDAGVAVDVGSTTGQKNFVQKKVAYGTHNYLHGLAMTEAGAALAMQHGRDIVNDIAATGCNTIGFGEMGIGNTSSASLLMSVLFDLKLNDCIGRGTGTTDEQLLTKQKTLQAVMEKHADALRQPTDVRRLLSCIGGFEIAAMCGAYLQAAENGMVILVDGFIATAALAAARLENDTVTNNCLFAHCSNEQGHHLMLERLNAKPLLQLGLRLGEGTGAALAVPLVQSAVAFLNEMASFESAGISNKE